MRYAGNFTYPATGQAFRVVMDENGAPLWIMVDLCKILGRPRSSDLMARLPEHGKRKIPEQVIGAKYGQFHVNTVNYQGLMAIRKIEDGPIGKALFTWVKASHLPDLVRAGFLIDDISLSSLVEVPLDPGLKALTLMFGKRRTRVLRDGKGEPWWVAADVCAALGLVNVTQAMRRLDKSDYCHVADFIEADKPYASTGQNKNNNLALLVNEPGLYGLILESRKPEARKFVHWLTHDVLPKLRDTGTYTVPKAKPHPVQNADPHLPVLSIDWDDPQHIAQLVHQCLDRIALINSQLKDSTPRLDAALFYGGVRPLLPTPVERTLLLFTQQHQVGKRLQKTGYTGRLKESVARELKMPPASIQRATEFATAFQRVQACSEVAAAKILSGYVSDALSGLHKTNVLDDDAIRSFADAVAQTSWHCSKIADLTGGVVR